MNYKNIYDACNHVASSVKDLSLIVDLGARHGEGYETFGINFPDSDYVFVEPSPRCIPKIVNKFGKNKKIKLIDGVIGLEDGEVDFFMLDDDDDQSGNLYTDRNGVYGRASLCKVKSYDHRKLFDRDIGFLKCNIEGGEYSLIKEGFFDKVKSFVMEAHNVHVAGKTYKDVVDSLREKFDLEVWGNINYKYCFINGIRKSR